MARRKPRYHEYEDTLGEHRWRVTAGNGRILSDSGEGYQRPQTAAAGALASAIAIIEALQPELLVSRRELN